jgi:GT2 family glycosyltransferase
VADSVALGYLHPGLVHGEFLRSIIKLLVYDVGHEQRIVGDGGFVAIPAGPNLSAPRCRMVRSFLKSGIEWLWMVDTDMTFPPDTLDRLMAVADKNISPIVGGLCFALTYEEGERVIYPTMFLLDDDGSGWRILEYPPDSLIDIHATGTACLLIHRTVLEKMEGTYPEPLPWFAEQISPAGGLQSEDVTFCLRARECGFPVKVHTGVKLGHLKQYEVTEDVYRGVSWPAATPASTPAK